VFASRPDCLIKSSFSLLSSINSKEYAFIQVTAAFLRIKESTHQATAKNCIFRNLVIFNPHKILLDDEIKEDVIGWACGTHES
jgi:hypothetical protein